MSYIILETINPEMINVECDEDGNTLFFDSKQDAFEYARNNMQYPIIVNIPAETEYGETGFIDREVIAEFLEEKLNGDIPEDVSIDDLTCIFAEYVENDFYEWLKDNFKSFFNSYSWMDIKKLINDRK